jgi:hypothetical protein
MFFFQQAISGDLAAAASACAISMVGDYCFSHKLSFVKSFQSF